MSEKKRGIILFVPDERLPRGRAQLVTRAVNTLRQLAPLEILRPETTETDLLKKLHSLCEKKDDAVSLVLVPWYRYFSWKKAEGFFGATRARGPTFAGYFGQPLKPSELSELEFLPPYSRTLLFDLHGLQPSEATLLLSTLLEDDTRSGMMPLLADKAPLYCEHWTNSQGIGLKMDAVCGLPDVQKFGWGSRAASVRISLAALWSLIYEEGPGRPDARTGLESASPRAYFQVGADEKCLALRLCFPSRGWSPKDSTLKFWPDPTRPTSPAQLLMRHGDIVRVHTISNTSWIEIMVAFVKSQPSENGWDEVHTLWVDPVSPRLFSELPPENIPENDSRLRKLPTESAPTPLANQLTEQLRATERMLGEAQRRIRDLKAELGAKTDLVEQLRRGGVGSARSLPPPDAEALLDAFAEKFRALRAELDDLDQEFALAHAQGAGGAMEALKKKKSVLAAREQEWLARVALILQPYLKKTAA